MQWKSKRITYSENVFVVLGIEHAMRMCHIVACGLSGSTTFFHIISETVRFSKTKVRGNKMCFFLSTIYA